MTTHYSQNVWDAFLPAILLLLGFITFYTSDIGIASDMGWYMNSGLNIFLGKGYTDMDGSLILKRGPLFPLMIAVSYWLFGVSSWSAFWVVRIFCILNPIMIYFLGKRFFGKGVGFAAALLILTSYSMDFWSYRHLDPVWPFFVLLANYFTTVGFEKKRMIFFILSGICIGMAVLIKQIALAFLPLPLMMSLTVQEYRTRKMFLYAGANVVSGVVVFLPWLFFLWQNDSLRFLFGTGSSLAADMVSVPIKNSRSVFDMPINFLRKFGDFVLGVWRYYYVGRNAISDHFILAPCFVLAWIFAGIAAVRKNRYAIILFLNFLLFLPIIYYLGKMDMRLGQGIFILLLSYLVLAWLLASLIGAITRRVTDSATLRCIGFSIVIACLLGVQVFDESEKDLGYREFLDQSIPYKWFKGEDFVRHVNGPFGNDDLKKSILKLTNIVGENDAVMVGWMWKTYARLTYFEMGGQHSVSYLPLKSFMKARIDSYKKPYREHEKPLWVYPHFLGPLDSKYRLFMLFESDLLQEIEEKDIKYVLLTPRLWELNKYFTLSKSFEEVETFKTEAKPKEIYRIYRVVGNEILNKPFDTIFTNAFKGSMAKFKRKHPEEYEIFKEKYIYGIAGITPDSFRDIELKFK